MQSTVIFLLRAQGEAVHVIHDLSINDYNGTYATLRVLNPIE